MRATTIPLDDSMALWAANAVDLSSKLERGVSVHVVCASDFRVVLPEGLR